MTRRAAGERMAYLLTLLSIGYKHGADTLTPSMMTSVDKALRVYHGEGSLDPLEEVQAGVGWTRCDERLPKVFEDMWCKESVWLLVKSDGEHWVAKYRVFDDDDIAPVWVQRGRDGEWLDNVTEWRELPA